MKTIAEMEIELISKALKEHSGNIDAIIKSTGVSKRLLITRIYEYNLKHLVMFKSLPQN